MGKAVRSEKMMQRMRNPANILDGKIFYHEEHEVHEEKKDNYEIDERRETLRRNNFCSTVMALHLPASFFSR